MTIEAHLNDLLEHLSSANQNDHISSDQLIQSIDLTLLDENASDDALTHLFHLAQTNKIAAVCVFTKHLHYFLQENRFNRATVVNFPQGNSDVATILKNIDLAIELGANEIDYVFPYQMYLTDNKQNALNQCNSIAEYCREQRLSLKVILETGAFPDIQTIHQVCTELLKFGCDFLKTSTGKIPQGASLSAVFAILSAIKDSGKQCGIKISGGVKTTKQARSYAYLAELMMGKKINANWFRLGASSLLDELLKDN